MDMVFFSGWRESVPCPSVAHGFPFPGDSISFRPPRQPTGAIPGLPWRGSRGMACPFLEQQKTPSKAQPYWLLFIGCGLMSFFLMPFLFLSERETSCLPQAEKAGALQSTFVVKRSTPAKM